MEPVSCIPNLCFCPIAQQWLNLQAQIRVLLFNCAAIIDHSLIASVAVLLQLECQYCIFDAKEVCIEIIFERLHYNCNRCQARRLQAKASKVKVPLFTVAYLMYARFEH